MGMVINVSMFTTEKPTLVIRSNLISIEVHETSKGVDTNKGTFRNNIKRYDT